MRTRRRKGWRRYVNVLTVATTITVLFVVLPVLWMIVSSFKGPASINTAFVQYDFGKAIETSLIVTVCSTVLVLGIGTLAGYGLGRMPMRGKLPIMVALLMISVFPSIAVVAPLFLLMREIGWLNSYQGLILPYTAFNLPFAIWILRNYMLGIPKEMEETGRIDGAGPLRTVWTIILPMALPGVFTAGIFCFTACWTEFLMALTFESVNNWRTIPVGIAEFGTPLEVPYGTIFAASVVAVVPIGILVFIFRKFVISGLTSGAVKG
jgi:multiple sugar transport system permease protein